MELILLCTLAFLASVLTFFSGFGLGTLLTPVMMIYFPVEIAIALTGIVHLFNNLFKLILVGKHAKKEVLIKFGIPAVLFAILGSFLMLYFKDLPPLYSYSLFNHDFSVYPFKFLVSILLIFFAILDLTPSFQTLAFSPNKLPLGGILSGFFGGLSGNQGAFRTAFLIKAGLSKEQFIGTAVVVSTFVDLSRLSLYSSQLFSKQLIEHLPLLVGSTSAAIMGAVIGHRLLKKVTFIWIQRMVAIFLIVISIGLALGFI
jgi:uncharacterized protein